MERKKVRQIKCLVHLVSIHRKRRSNDINGSRSTCRAVPTGFTSVCMRMPYEPPSSHVSEMVNRPHVYIPHKSGIYLPATEW